MTNEAVKLNAWEVSADTVMAVQGEVNGRTLTVTIIDRSGELDSTSNAEVIDRPLDLTGKTLQMYVGKPDGKACLLNGSIKDAENGIAEFTLSQQSTAVKGKASLEVWITDSQENTLKIIGLTLDVKTSGEADIESTNEFQTLLQATQEAKSAAEAANNAANAANEATEEAETATKNANAAAGSANTEASKASQAASNADDAVDRANTAIQNAVIATQAANTASDNAGVKAEVAQTAADRANEAADKVDDALAGEIGPAIEEVLESQKGEANGIASLGSSGTIPTSQIPILPPIVQTSGTGFAFTATIDGVTELTIGMLITIIPHTASRTTTPTLNINGLGEKGIRRRYSHTSGSVTDGYATTWLSSRDPQLLQYDGTYWIAVGANKPYMSDLSSPVSVSKGGTGKTSWSSYQLIYPSSTTTLSQLAFPTTAGSFLRQGSGGAPYWTSPEDICDAISALPSSGGTLNGNLTVLSAGTYPKLELISSDESEARIGAIEHSVAGKNLYLCNRSSDRTKWSQLVLYPESSDPIRILRLVLQADNWAEYILYGTHNVTVADSTPTEFVGEGTIVFCTSNHSIYRGINGANVRFY